jgi:hypothetical protein
LFFEFDFCFAFFFFDESVIILFKPNNNLQAKV